MLAFEYVFNDLEPGFAQESSYLFYQRLKCRRPHLEISSHLFSQFQPFPGVPLYLLFTLDRIPPFQ